ncbi:hypothetical protein F2Q69_00035226 [Brassica cretica]|uniref:Uncharacterized protein n=1 Tax=Brassica cretica TaxID=69181 RepID=A0A8S9SEP2_BRACR|nr:hypothetical protein F2Q69_00035226 [Brassica cretica]
MLDGPVVEFAFLARQVFLCTRFVVGSAYFVGLVARYLFRPGRALGNSGVMKAPRFRGFSVTPMDRRSLGFEIYQLMSRPFLVARLLLLEFEQETDRAVYRIDPRTSGLELRPDPRPNDRTDRTKARLSRTTRQAKVDGQAIINLGRASFDSDRDFSLLACLARTACTGDCADDLASLFDPIMDFIFGYFSKARILKLSEDLGHAGTQLIRFERPLQNVMRPLLIVPLMC